MLTYVFWHIPAPSANRENYERLLVDFHKTLAAHAPAGFRSSLAFRTQNAPWIGNGAAAYEDWYLVDNSTALDAINDAAVSGPRKGPHDLVASLAASGAAGLYRLKSGQVSAMRSARHALWFSKPAISYDALFAQLGPITEALQTLLWMRQMVLSAGPEFCIRSATQLVLPKEIAVIHCPVQAIYPA
ncbi:MAG TPA: hypothetical protein VGP99_04435 [Tepidisphaeraceae bacterium]|jgi:hypothetical protein|nr:hypothetical protein [Tepidisphaeraceae bacterium]